MDMRADKPLTRRQRAKLATREKVLNAARQSFIEKGYLKSTIRDIAKLAGMSTGAFFASFPSKEACLEAIIAEEHEEEFQLFEATKSVSRIPTETIRGMFGLSYARWSKERGLLRAWMTQYWVGHEDLEALTKMYERRIIDVLKHILVLAELHDVARLAGVITSLHMDNLRYLGVDTKGDTTFPEIRLGVQLELLITHGQHLGPGCA
jgi:AcrR family transcriptional regulator